MNKEETLKTNTSQKKKIIAAGHICLDITPVFPDKKITKLDTLLSPGKLVQTGAADVHTGGSVANTGLALKILGADVSLMGKIGCDAFGDMICNILKKYDADRHMIRSKEESTSYSVVLAIPGIDRIFLHNPGANGTFCSKDIDTKALEDAALFHFGYPTLMRAMYENDGQELISLMKTVKEAGLSTSLDMAAVDADSEAGQVEWHSILKKLLPYVDFFVPSVEELCFMLDKARFKEWQQRAEGKDITEVLDIQRDVKPLADICMSYGAKVLLIKCGAPGIYYRTADRQTLETVGERIALDSSVWAEKEGFEASYVPDRVLSGTGAGDTSIAAFLAAVLNGESPEEAMHLATAAGASCVTAYDALSGLKSLEELKAKIKAGWKKNEEVTVC
ncbi:MAG: carbohydrate kinase family protein [Lachnospiraceae bacterium]|nr:carbohydrate kinase family protein [Lachnospiraceae bacterium]